VTKTKQREKSKESTKGNRTLQRNKRRRKIKNGTATRLLHLRCLFCLWFGWIANWNKCYT